MNCQLIGGALIVAACGGYGLALSAGYRQRERELESLVQLLNNMENQLSYQLTPLPELCRQVGKEEGGIVGEVFRNLARELDRQSAPRVSACMVSAIAASHQLPPGIRPILLRLGKSLGRFDLPGQLRGLQSARQQCAIQQEALRADREPRLRSYRTLGLCAGAALAILLM